MPIYLASRSPRRVQLLAQMGLNCTVLPADIDETELVAETPQDYVKRLAFAKAQACIAQNALSAAINTENLITFDRCVTDQAMPVTANQVSNQALSPGSLIVLAADTTVAIDQEILGKPTSDADAFAMLQKLSGASHDVHTAVAGVLLNVDGTYQTAMALSSTRVQMMALSEAQIHHYIASGEHLDKAGSYGIQGLAGTWVQHIAGSYTGVMGLPVHETAHILRTFGAYAL